MVNRENATASRVGCGVVTAPRFIFVVSDDPHDEGWVWAALDRMKPVARGSGLMPPAILSTPVMHVLAASGGQEWPNVQTSAGSAQDPIREPDTLLHTYASAARRVPTSERRIRRLVADGELPAVSIGKCRYIHPVDLVEYVDGLRERGES